MKNNKNTVRGASILLLATFTWGWFGILFRITGSNVPLFFQTSVRSIVTSLLLLVILLISRKWSSLHANEWGWVTARGLFGLLASALFFTAVNKIPIGTAYFSFYTGSTLGGYAVGRLMFKEQLNKVKWLALLLTLTGLALIYSFDFGVNYIHLSVALGAGICASLWNTLTKKLPSNIEASQLGFLDNSMLVVLGLAISLLIKESWTFPTMEKWWLANYMVGVLQVVTGILVVKGFRYVEAQIGSLILLMEILFGIILGYVFYNEALALRTILGGLLIISGVSIPEIISLRKTTSQ
ncbi:MAG: DMT family transporter [Patescibacteria group bacterium]